MALRAGYYGVKKSVLAALSNLSGAKIIKSIGDGLKLTSAGKLSCDIDTNTMEFKSGKLASKGGGKYDLLAGSETWPGDLINNVDVSEVIDNYDIIVASCSFGTQSSAASNFFIPVDLLKQCTDATASGKHWFCALNPHADQWIRIQYDNGVLKNFGTAGVGVNRYYGIKL